MKPVSNGRRPRGRPNRKQHGGQSRPNNFDSSGPEGRVRGNAHQVYERYLAMARDAVSAGDRVAAETYYQHAEHYFRVLNSSTDPQPNGQARQDRRGDDGRRDDNRPDGSRQDQSRPEGAGHESGRQDEPQLSETRNGNQPAVSAANGQDAPLAPAPPEGRGRRQPRRKAPVAATPESAKGNGTESESDNADAQSKAQGDGDGDGGGCEPASV